MPQNPMLDPQQTPRVSDPAAITSRVLDAIPDGILAFDREFRYTAWNPAMERIAGVPAARVLGRVAWEVFPFLAQEGEDEYFRAALAGEERTAVDRPFRVPESGREGIFQATYAPLRDGAGAVVGGMALVRDVTDARRARQEVQMRGRVLESMSEGVSISDEAGFILYTNPAEDRMFGYAPGELVGQHVTVQNSYPPGENERIVAEVIEALRRDGVWTGEWSNRRKDGTPFVTFARITSLEMAGRRCWVCVQEDITRRKQAEQARERAAARTRHLLAITATLAGTTTLAEAARTIVDEGVAGLGAAGGLFVRPVEGGSRLALVHALGYPAEVHDRWRSYPADAEMPTAVAFRTGEPLFLESREEALRRFPGLATTGAEAGIDGWIVVPIVAHEQSVGVLAFRFSGERKPWDAEDRAFVFALAHQGALALERARLFDAERAARERVQLLADAGTLLASSLDVAQTLDEVARLVVPRMADWCFVERPTADGRVELVTVHHPDAELVELARASLLRNPVDPDAPHGTAAVLRTGHPELMERIPDEFFDLVGQDDEHLSLLRRVGFRSYVSLPLSVRGRIIGVLSLVMSASGRTIRREDLPFAEDLARRVALAMDNAQLFAAEQAARVAAERAAERSRRLQAVAAALNQALTPAQVAELCVVNGMAALGANAGSLSVLVGDGAAFEIVHTSGYPAELADRWKTFPVTPGRPLSDAILRRAPVLVGTEAEWTAQYPQTFREIQRSGGLAFAAIPVMVGSRPVAGLSFNFHDERHFDEGDRTFLATLGEQAAQALERARLYEAERRARTAAERLQDLTAALSEALTTPEVGEAVMGHGVAALGAGAGVLALRAGAEEELEIVASIGYPPEACMGPGRRWPLGAAIPIAEATRTGTTVLVGSPEEWGARYTGGYAPRSGSSAAWAAVPIVLDGRPAGALLWTYLQPRPFDPEEATLMETMARLCSQALERAHLLEAERAARAEAEAANRAKTEFLSAMSHELRTPLNAIAGYVDLLELGVRGPLTEVQLSDLGRIRRAQGVLLGLINDVLNFARLEAGRIDYRLEAIPLAGLLAELEAFVDPQVRTRQLGYRCEPCDDGLAALGDPERTRQILINLLSNAVKFTDPGGMVTVSARADGDSVLVRVTDTGRGIPEGRLAEIFDPFVQLERHRTEASQQGVGLGLAISRELARGMSGDLTVESEPGRGSTFTLVLPRAGGE